MSWANPFAPRTPNTVTHYGWAFEWTDAHMSEEEASRLKHECDELADRALAKLEKLSPSPPPAPDAHPPRRRSPRTDGAAPASKPDRDLVALLRDNASSDPDLAALWTQATSEPEWVDWAQLARGQDVFYRYAAPMMTGMAYQSLLGGMGFSRVVSTLALTGGFSVRNARKRIFETTQHVLQVTKSVDALRAPAGEGFEATLRVRLLHAAVRRRIMRLAAQKEGYYDIERNGVPVNALDSIGTIAAFGPSIIWLSLPRQGIYLTQAEIADYIALWRYVAHVIGSPTHHFATPATALAALQSIYSSDLQPDDRSRVLANNIVQALHNQPPAHASAEYLIASARWLIGNQLGDDLGLHRQAWYYEVLLAAQCLFFMLYCYPARVIPAWNRRVQRRMREVSWRVVVEGKTGLGGNLTMFGFQYVPEFGLDTGKGESWEAHSPESQKKRSQMRNLTLLGMVTMMLAAGVWASVRVILRLTAFLIG